MSPDVIKKFKNKKPSAQSKRIALVNHFSDWRNALAANYWVKAISGIHDIAITEETGIDVFSNANDATVRRIIGEYDGIIAALPQADQTRPIWKKVWKRIPTVAIMSRSKEGYASVMTDEGAAMDLVVQHLLKEGHRRLFFASFGVESFERERYRGFLRSTANEEVERRGFFFNKIIDPSGIQNMMNILLPAVMEKKPDAIVFTSDIFASYFMRAMAAKGWRIPEDIGMVGFNDSPDYPIPTPLTSIRHDGTSIGRQAARLLFSLIRGEGDPRERSFIEPSLVVRRSSLKRTLEDRRDDSFKDFMNERIRDSYAYPELLRELPATLGMTPNAFSKRFKKTYRRGFVDHVNAYRISQAARMLEGAGSITEIMMNCGFNSHANFMKIFKRTYACTPREYRMRRRVL